MIRTNRRAALYARFSSDNQRSESIDAQIRAMNDYCNRNSITIVNTYVDEAKSATTDKRPSFQKMIADSNLEIFDIVLVHKLDRFARNRYDSAIYKRELKKHNVQVFSVLENLDDSPESIMMEAVLEGMSEYYSQNLARETMKGMKETAYQCKHTGGKPPLGYDIDPITRKLVINEYESETVQIIFDMYSKGYGYTSILDELHSQNRKTKIGNDFMKNSLYSILTNPKYKGIYIFNRSSERSPAGTRNTHKYKDMEDVIAIEGGCPQIVDAETYDKVQERITYNKHHSAQYIAKENYLLSGVLYCKDCGKAMCGNRHSSGKNKNLHVTYRCQNNNRSCSNREINKEYLERYVVDLLEKEIFNSKSMARITNEINRKQEIGESSVATRLNETEEKLKNTSEAIKNVADAISSGLLSNALVEKLNELEQDQAFLQEEKTALLQQNGIESKNVDPQFIISEYSRVKDTPSSPEYKTFIRSFIDRIVIGKYSVDITLKTGLDVYPELNRCYSVRRQDVYEYGKTEV